MRLNLLIPLTLATFMLACNDDKSPTASASGKDAILIGAKWKMTAHTITPAVDYDGNGTLVTNLFAVEHGCGHDDIDSYTSDHKFSFDEGPTKCDASDPQKETGTWSFNSAGDSLTIDSDLDPVPMKLKVVEVSATKLVLSSSDDSWGDGVHTEVLTFSAQ
ncbi:MAG: hypothetical protein ABIW76_12040 [Fibrobacteria bacterium]